MTYARRAWIIFWKDLLVERRSKEQTNALLFFCLLLLFLFQFALGPDREPPGRRAARPALARASSWPACSASAGASWPSARTTAGRACGSRPGDKSAIYLGKLAGNCVLMAAVEVVLVVLFGVFYDVDLWTPARARWPWCWPSAPSGSPRWARSSPP